MSYVGFRVGNVTLIKFSHKSKNGFPKWLYRCDCGKEQVTFLSAFTRTNPIQSCGCITKSFKHGLEKTRFYRIWRAMKRRCLDKGFTSYARYGGIGVKLHWETFLDFKNDMYESYLEHVKKFGEKNTSIDRIDNNKGYSKDNCRWATLIEQQRNRKITKKITFQGEEMTIADVARVLGVKYNTIHKRVALGWSEERLLSNK